MHALVAEGEGRLVGLAHYLVPRSTTAIALSCYMQHLFTSQAVRGRGAQPAQRSVIRRAPYPVLHARRGL